ncbi:SRPBCC family protein [Actinacidiphila sp. bgisy144]|uniref:SRPBCC family protein n=1 Tax=Actinacidiphila sp. bgisy144 TaxID=3413791 RepID=UPI003EBC7F42
MPESATRTLRESVTGNPEVERLRTEVRDYLQARAVKAVEGLGARLGEGVGRLGEGGGGLAGPLAKGGKAISEGKSPAQALTAAGTAHLKDTVKEKVKGLFSGSGKGRGGGGKSKSVTIVEDIDIGVPVRQAYDQWTRFQEFSTFAKGVVSVEKADDTTTNWKVKVAKSTRSWRANVTEQIPDERIAWTTEGAKGTVKGVVTFHPITDDLTRVLLVLEYFPKGFVEKTGNIWRAQGRRARLDLKLYRKFVMMRGEDADGWRGEIHDGKVTVGHEQAVEDEDGGQDARDRDDERDPDADEAEFTDGADDADELPDDELPEEDLADDEIGEDADLPEEEDADLPEDDAEDYGPEDAEDAEDAEPEELEEPEEEPARRPRRRPATARR